MAILDDLRYAVPLTAEDMMPETDMVPVFHPDGGHATTRSISLSDLAASLGGEGSGVSGVSRADFDELKSSVMVDLNNLRDTIMQASLDADEGVATDTWVATGTPPALTTE